MNVNLVPGAISEVTGRILNEISDTDEKKKQISFESKAISHSLKLKLNEIIHHLRESVCIF